MLLKYPSPVFVLIFVATCCSSAPVLRSDNSTTIRSADITWTSLYRNATDLHGLQSTDNPEAVLLYFNASFLKLTDSGTVADGVVVISGHLDEDLNKPKPAEAYSIKFRGEEVNCIGPYCFLNKSIPAKEFEGRCTVRFHALIYQDSSGHQCKTIYDENCLTAASRPLCKVVMHNPGCSIPAQKAPCPLPHKLDSILTANNETAAAVEPTIQQSTTISSTLVTTELEQCCSEKQDPQTVLTATLPTTSLLIFIVIIIAGSAVVYRKSRPQKAAITIRVPVTILVPIGDPDFNFDDCETARLLANAASQNGVQSVQKLPQFRLDHVFASQFK